MKNKTCRTIAKLDREKPLKRGGILRKLDEYIQALFGSHIHMGGWKWSNLAFDSSFLPRELTLTSWLAHRPLNGCHPRLPWSHFTNFLGKCSSELQESQPDILSPNIWYGTNHHIAFSSNQ